MKLEKNKLTIEVGDKYGHYKFNGVDAISGKSTTLEFDNCILLTDGDIITEDLMNNLRTLCQLEKGQQSSVNVQFIFMKFTDDDELIPVGQVEIDRDNNDATNIYLSVESEDGSWEIVEMNDNGIIGSKMHIKKLIH